MRPWSRARSCRRVGLPVELRGTDLDRQRGEVLAGVEGDRPLDQPEVARADHADPRGVPGLLADPAQRREAVRALVDRAELALRAEGATDALDENLQAALSQQPAEDQADQLTPSVGGAHEHSRLRAPAARARDVAIREQH